MLWQTKWFIIELEQIGYLELSLAGTLEWPPGPASAFMYPKTVSCARAEEHRGALGETETLWNIFQVSLLKCPTLCLFI